MAVRSFSQTKMYTPDQILSILTAVATDPKWPSAVEVPDLSRFDPTHQALKQKLFDRLHADGFLEMVPGEKGRRTSQGYRRTPKGAAEAAMLSKHPALAGKK